MVSSATLSRRILKYFFEFPFFWNTNQSNSAETESESKSTDFKPYSYQQKKDNEVQNQFNMTITTSQMISQDTLQILFQKTDNNTENKTDSPIYESQKIDLNTGNQIEVEIDRMFCPRKSDTEIVKTVEIGAIIAQPAFSRRRKLNDYFFTYVLVSILIVLVLCCIAATTTLLLE